MTAATLPGYITGLTPVLLRADTQVTAFSLGRGAVSARQSVLQAGTAVLVDERGLPRLRCASGSPLAAPVRVAPTASRVGDPWPGFDVRATVTMTPAANPRRQFGLVGPTGATIFRRPVGSVGPQDINQSPNSALLEGVYIVRGSQVACDHINNCASNLPVSITIRLRDCSPTRCTISAPEFWTGDFPFTLVDGFWSVTATRLEGRADCHGAPIPSLAFDLTLTPGDFVIDADGVWRANSLTGPARRYSGAFRTCAAASQTWNAVAKRSG